ncbi:hypothetical protein LPICM17_70063 [Lactococcus piscium]|uniref:PBECR4 domain-containing protein n=1 Tax=Pseudolactococcus carnosus TaxID=2749961 RepID=UPI000BDC6A97|nr:PBECR4 domain-containing protein [Lactococcus carnosus]SOB48989.1 hypothetical protein LPICM17_70063 [Lactococcus piscium]MCJ1973062.1 toprim domain-containing protein [Lactococcus carnosus]MCJ1975564.1 toprim domain-containing protein [Lactococcus carnosus]MCJ1985809.1 toprim domain-containing protein [Lactococcus carnosus]MCJ1987418.1 toprim domain-containing protein [Lactococcus carnosus]
MSKQDKTELDKKFEAARNQLRQKSILEVAQALGMSFNGNEWTEHDSFKIDFKKNRASWYSQGEDYRNMDVFELVMKMRDVPYRDAYQFVKTGDFKQLEIKHDPKEPFEYKLKPFEDATFSEARAYLKNERQLSDETIDFFIDKEVLVQATRRTNVSDVTELAGDYYYDPVVAFKVLDRDKTVIGTSLVGIGDKAVYSLPGTPVRRKQIGWNSDGLGGLNVSIGTPNRIVIVEAPIDLMSYYELHKDNLQDVTLVALDGSGTKMSTVKRYVLDLASNGHWSQSLDRSGLATAFDMVLENTDLFKKRDNLITVAVDNDEAGKKMVNMFEEQGIPVVVDLPPLHDSQTKNDWNDELKYIKGGKVVTTTQEKEYEMTEINSQMDIKKAPELTQELLSSDGGTFNRNPSFLSDNITKVALQPVEQAQPAFLTDDLLHFNIKNSKIKVRKEGYFPIKENELRKLNLIAPSLQKTAQFYAQNLSGTTVNYIYKDGSDYSTMAVRFEAENFMHLTGIMPYISDSPRTASETLKDFAEGNGNFDNILVSSAFKDKLTVLPLISEIVDSKSFLLDDLSDVEKFKRLQLDKAIKTEDEELLVAFRDVDGIGMPASVIKLKPNSNLKLQMDEHIEDKTILGVFRERDGIFDTLSINDDLVLDGGKELKSILENGQVENILSSETLLEKTESTNLVAEEVGFLIADKMRADAEDEGFLIGDSDHVLEPIYLFPDGSLLDGMTTWGREEVLATGYKTVRDLDHYILTSYIPEALTKGIDNKLPNFEKLGIIRLVPETKVAILPSENITDEQIQTLKKIQPETIVQSWDDKTILLSDLKVQGSIGETKLEPDQNIIDAARTKDVKALSVHLKDGIKQYLNSDQYKLFLNAMSKFHKYSPKNVQMILAQKPDAELIAPAGHWKSEFERFPAKGSKAIYIWDYREKLSKNSDGEVIVDENGKPKKESYFILAPKFDVSQTTGKDIPKAVYELEDGKAFDQVHAANLYRSLKTVSEANGVPVSFENISNGANGFYSPMEHAITINKGMGQTQTLKTLIHEMAHSDLHNNKARETHAYTYSNQELQAESVAYVVAQHYGIDTSSYSFGYLANWSNDKVGLSDLEAQLKVVHKEAKDLITRIDTAMEKVVEVQTSKAASNPFKAKLLEEKEKATQAKEVAGDDQIKKDQGVHRQESGRTL